MPDQKESSAQTAIFLVDEHGLNAMGLKLIAGRNFSPAEVQDKTGLTDLVPPSAVIITKALAEKLFPGKNALGQSIYVDVPKTAGSDRRHRRPAAGSLGRGGRYWGSKFHRQFDLGAIPLSRHAIPITWYARSPASLPASWEAAKKRLFEVNRGRVLEKVDSDDRRARGGLSG